MQDSIIHILERFGLHFVSSAFVMLAFYFVYDWLKRKYDILWLPGGNDNVGLKQELIVIGLLVACLFPLREPYDLYFGNNGIVKCYTDTLSWWVGAFVSGWGLYRFKKV